MLTGGASPDTDMTSLTVLSPSRVEILNVHLVSNRRQLTGMSCCFNFCHTNMCHLSHDTVVHSTKSIFFVWILWKVMMLVINYMVSFSNFQEIWLYSNFFYSRKNTGWISLYFQFFFFGKVHCVSCAWLFSILWNREGV